jgi:hypothetical protein
LKIVTLQKYIFKINGNIEVLNQKIFFSFKNAWNA